jgi:hypothetical protein
MTAKALNLLNLSVAAAPLIAITISGGYIVLSEIEFSRAYHNASQEVIQATSATQMSPGTNKMVEVGIGTCVSAKFISIKHDSPLQIPPWVSNEFGLSVITQCVREMRSTVPELRVELDAVSNTVHARSD